MAPIAMFFGFVLTILGIVLYATAEAANPSPTALIPSAFGVVLLALGIIAGRGSERTRMHAMHAAALIGLIGLVFPGVRAIMLLRDGAELSSRPIVAQLAMAAICGVFLVLCVMSFIAARRARKERQTTSEPPA